MGGGELPSTLPRRGGGEVFRQSYYKSVYYEIEGREAAGI